MFLVLSSYSVADNNVGGSPPCTAAIAEGHASIKTMFGTSAGRARLASLFHNTPAWYEDPSNQAEFAGSFHPLFFFIFSLFFFCFFFSLLLSSVCLVDVSFFLYKSFFFSRNDANLSGDTMSSTRTLTFLTLLPNTHTHTHTHTDPARATHRRWCGLLPSAGQRPVVHGAWVQHQDDLLRHDKHIDRRPRGQTRGTPKRTAELAWQRRARAAVTSFSFEERRCRLLGVADVHW